MGTYPQGYGLNTTQAFVMQGSALKAAVQRQGNTAVHGGRRHEITDQFAFEYYLNQLDPVFVYTDEENEYILQKEDLHKAIEQHICTTYHKTKGKSEDLVSEVEGTMEFEGD